MNKQLVKLKRYQAKPNVTVGAHDVGNTPMLLRLKPRKSPAYSIAVSPCDCTHMIMWVT